MIRYEKDNIYLNQFSDISELYNYITKTPRRSTAGRASEKDEYNFSNTHNIEEAYDLLLGGDDNLFKKFKSLKKISVDKLLGNAINRHKQMNDVVGFQANVPQYLLGLPTNMINQEPKKISQKVLNILLSIGVSGGVETYQIENLGNLYIQVLDLLEKSGYRTNLYLLEATEAMDKDIYCLTRIKTDREPFNIKKCIFPIMHPSYLRRIMFKWDEVCDINIGEYEDFTQGGYGRPKTDTKKIKSHIDKILKTNFIVWKFQEFDDDDSINVEAERVLKELKSKYGIDIIGKEE